MVSKLDDSGSEDEHEEESTAPATVGFDNLQSLFKGLSLAYVEDLTSPRWSHFKGAGFALKNKVRLNNLIWREYHMQCTPSIFCFPIMIL